MRNIFFISLLLIPLVSIANQDLSTMVPQDGKLYETYPGTNKIRYDRPSLVRQGNKLYQVVPGMANRIDYGKPAFVIDGDTVYQTLPGQNRRDYQAPAYKLQ